MAYEKEAFERIAEPGPAKTLNYLESCVIQVLQYFGIFNYPLRRQEVFSFLPYSKTTPEEMGAVLDSLVHSGLVCFRDGYYSLDYSEGSIQRRLRGNKTAEDMMSKARRYSALIAAFPFVRAVCISGSLSKGYLDEHGDIDYFIITKPGKLWIARTLLVAYKKIFLRNRHKYFCLNYFIDTDHFEIPDKNIFTATELTTLMPMVNLAVIEAFKLENRWVEKYLPNIHAVEMVALAPRISWIKKIGELAFSNVFGNWLDGCFMRLTMRRWKRKFGHMKDQDFEQAMRSRKYVSKHHPQNFQKKVLQRLQEGIHEFEEKNQLKLHRG